MLIVRPGSFKGFCVYSVENNSAIIIEDFNTEDEAYEFKEKLEKLEREVKNDN